MSIERNHRQRGGAGASELLSAVPLAVLVVLSGVIISLYTVFVHSFTVRGSAEDCLKRAALTAAARLSAVAVDDPVFGRVGLCDRAPEVPGRVGTISLNSLYGTLRLDHLIARQLNLPYVDRLVSEDVQRVRGIEHKLRQALSHAAVTTFDEANSSRRDSLYEMVQDMLARGQNGNNLIALRIKLGTTAPCLFTSLVPYAGDAGGPRAANGQYKAGAVIEIGDNQWAQLYQQATEPRLCDEHYFQMTTSQVTPSMVLIEAVYNSGGAGDSVGVTRTLSACAVVGSPPAASPDTVFMVSFPQGDPDKFHSLLSVLKCDAAVSGEWQRAVQESVPGKGYLEACELADMTPSMAAQQCFYHWLRSQATQPSVSQVVAAANYVWSEVSSKASADAGTAQTESVPNSALTKDTGARLFAYLNQSAAGGSGQPALHNAFSGLPLTSYFPPSALPLEIDSHGACHLAGCAGFDDKLVQDFLSAVYRTNWAAVESASIARAVSDRMPQAFQEMEQQIFTNTEELNSLSSRLGQAAGAGKTGNEKELARLRRTQSELTLTVNNLKSKLEDYRRVKRRAQKLLMNAEYTQKVTYDLTAGMKDFARDGLFRAANPDGFLLRNNIVFCPKTTPASEDDLYAADSKVDDPSSWISDHFNVMQSTASGTMVGGKLLSAAASLRSHSVAKPAFVIFDSRQLSAAGSAAPVVTDASPFAGSGLDAGQSVYYACDAVVTGQQPKVGWSVLARDLLSARTQIIELPSASAQKWRAADEFASVCPNLSAEIQVRSPVPLIPNLPVGSSLSNPQSGHEHVLQIPPMPASML
ncbi:MAG TPA: hypothetical protein V6D22_21795 [Candidatus Obscuribacterales bacterium]